MVTLKIEDLNLRCIASILCRLRSWICRRISHSLNMNLFFAIGITYFGLLISSFCTAREYSIEGRAAYFYPTSDRFREIYSGGGIYGLEFDAQIWKRLFIWGEVDYFSKSGRTDIDFGSITNASVNCCLKNCKEERTHVRIVPCSVGLKYYFNKDPVQFYLGAGVLASYLHTEVHSETLVKGRGKWGWGGAFKSGLLCHVTPSFFIDFFTDYRLVEVHLHRPHDKKVITHHADLSGFSFGGGLGYLF
jgi:hypothetical protein